MHSYLKTRVEYWIDYSPLKKINNLAVKLLLPSAVGWQISQKLMGKCTHFTF